MLRLNCIFTFAEFDHLHQRFMQHTLAFDAPPHMPFDSGWSRNKNLLFHKREQTAEKARLIVYVAYGAIRFFGWYSNAWRGL